MAFSTPNCAEWQQFFFLLPFVDIFELQLLMLLLQLASVVLASSMSIQLILNAHYVQDIVVSIPKLFAQEALLHPLLHPLLHFKMKGKARGKKREKSQFFRNWLVMG